MTGLLPRLQAAVRQRYTIERELGRGGMAFVYLARDHKHDRYVAVKVLRPELAAALGPERFLREIQIGARLAHPHILPVHDSGQAGELLYYVMPYVEGESLRLRLNRERQLPLDDALQIAGEVADALGYAHGHDVIHRDIKPGNILLTSGHALVADFGVARAITAAVGDRLTGTGFAVGTPGYMSPEQAANDRVDGRSDIYSLGCVLYEMLAGEPPFAGPNAQAVVALHSVGRVPSLRTLRNVVPKALDRTINRALARLPGDRFGTAAEFAVALEAAGARRPTVAARARRGALVVAALTALGAVVVVRMGKPSRAGADRAAGRELTTVTASPVAAERLRDGQARFWANDLDGAATGFRAAIEADSDLGLAYERLSVVETWRWDYPAARRAVEAGLARRERLAPRWRVLLEAQRHYVMRNADSAIAAFQGVTDDYASLVDGWYGLGEALYHFAGPAGHSPLRAQRVFERVAAQDSTFAPIFGHLVTLAIYTGDSARARAALAHMQPQDRERRAAEIAVTLAFGAPDTRAHALRSLDNADRATISLLVAWFGHAATNLPLVDTLASYLLKPGRTPDDWVRGAQYRLVALAGQGRWPDALRVWDSAAGGAKFDRWMVQAYFAGLPAKQVVQPMFAWARARMASGEAPDFAKPLWEEPQEAFRALVHRASLEGDSAEVLALLRRLEAAVPSADPSDPLPPAMRAALLARLALLAADTVRAIELLEQSVTRSGEPYATFFPLVALAPERWLLATLFAGRGQAREARRWLESFSNTLSYGDVLYGRRALCLRKWVAEPPNANKKRGLAACTS